MKKITFLVLLFFAIIKLQAQDYLISFAGTGASTEIATVKVENLIQGTSLTMPGNQVLHLKNSVTGIQLVGRNQINEIRFYPNPMNDFTFMEFDVPIEGTTQIELFDFSGRKILQTNKYLAAGRQTYRISGIQSGIYAIRITAGNHRFSGKLLCNRDVTGIPEIQYQKTNPLQITANELKSASSEVEMQYNEGDRLKFTATNDKYSTVKVDVPAESKKLTFRLVACTDADGKNYPVVQIGNQIWMAENLAYLPGVSPSSQGSNTAPYYYVYGYEGSDVATAKQQANYTVYGVLYNCPAAKAACPPGWRLPTDAEWTTLITSLGGEGAAGGKMKETGSTHWWSPNIGATNESGFSALPGGFCGYSGSFYEFGNYGKWWSSTEDPAGYVWSRDLDSDGSDVHRDYYYKKIGFSVRCVRGPAVITASITDITVISAIGGGIVTDGEGFDTVTGRGVCWNTAGTPTIADGKTTDGSGAGSFSSNLTGLKASIRYFVRAYIITDHDTVYGNEVTFHTPFQAGTFTDSRDGKTYKTIQIGGQIWMAENLAYLSAVSPSTQGSSTVPYYYVYGYEGSDVATAKQQSNYTTYGVLYNWPAAMAACPPGWHLPTDAEWKQLEMALGMTQAQADETTWRGTDQGTQMKTTTGWIGNGNGTNASGFSALPGGYRFALGRFIEIGGLGIWWSSTEYSASSPWYRTLVTGASNVSRNFGSKEGGFSVRCVRD